MHQRAFRSFLKKGKKGQQSSQEKSKSSNQVNGENSPILYRRALQYSSASTTGTRSTVGSPERYVYGGSITPLPRSRFQERLRSSSQYDTSSLSATPRMARSEITGSRLSVESTNPFDEDPVPPVRASRRKKKRAPPPPPVAVVGDVSVNSELSQTTELHITEADVSKSSKKDSDHELEELNTNIELKIVEDHDINENKTNVSVEASTDVTSNKERNEIADVINARTEDSGADIKSLEKTDNECIDTKETTIKSADSEDNILNSEAFPKVDIVKYRRNSSVNENDIRLRRGNLEDFHSLSSKRSKSLTNALDTNYMSYDINLNEHIDKDVNENDEPQKVVCKLYDESSRKQSIDTTSSTEKEFIEIDKATRELEREINKLNSALQEEDIPSIEERLSVSEIKRRFDKSDTSSPNPIPKPRRSHYGGSSSPV
ncbi:hypothetical protein O3G_MSEX001316 [Manduca sexta]|uniref:Uncharacterized protein n=1 Tax=Manduca sexta TaxID=7130 RepID=A0A922CBR8_MANSE|nr:hypothetical protein O3G_MSEX001316 [Manduca sexta]